MCGLRVQALMCSPATHLMPNTPTPYVFMAPTSYLLDRSTPGRRVLPSLGTPRIIQSNCELVNAFLVHSLHVIASVAKQSIMPGVEIASSLRSS